MSKIKFINQMEPWFGIEEQEALNKYMGKKVVGSQNLKRLLNFKI